MRDRDPRQRGWRRALAGGFIISVAIHVAVLLGLGLTTPGTEAAADAEPDGDRVAAWEADALRVIEVREPAPPAAEPASPAAAPGSGAASTASTPPLPASLEGAAPGSEAAERVLARFASLGVATEVATVAEAGGSDGPPDDARPARQAPPAYYDGRADFRPASRAAREADRDGRSPDLGGDAVAVSNRGRDAGRNGGRGGFSGGVSAGGACGVPAAINRIWDGGLIVGR